MMRARERKQMGNDSYFPSNHRLTADVCFQLRVFYDQNTAN